MESFLPPAFAPGTGWHEILQAEFKASYFRTLMEFLESERRTGRIYPPAEELFMAFELTPFEAVKVVILGQDPYHGEGQAHGLSFSVKHGVRQPPSLKNIFRELESDCGISVPAHGNLENWAKRGVLLLNATLSVRAGVPGSHQKKGWEQFTDAVIRKLSEKHDGLIFLLWGNYAKAKAVLIDEKRHHILTAAHPSPLAREGFKGCRHFSRTNELLIAMGKTPVDWSLV